METSATEPRITTLSFEIPSPISLNNAYADMIYSDKETRKLRVRRIPTPEAKAFKEEVAWICKSAANKAGWAYKDGMQIELQMLIYFKDRRHRDLSNRIKLAEDAIAEVLGFNDSWMTIYSLNVKSGGIDPKPRAIITLTAIQPLFPPTITLKERKGHVASAKRLDKLT